MNAAARLAHHGVLSRHLVFVYSLTKRQIALMFLTLSLLMSAIGIIYTTQMTRILYADTQRLLIEKDRLLSKQNQLLLERSTAMMQARTQMIAEQKLNMFIPDQKSVVIIHE